MSTIKTRVTHHTAVRRDGKPQLYAVNRYHRDKDWGGGWKQTSPSAMGWYVGYNFFIDEDGTYTQTRLVGEETIAQRGHNCDIEARCDAIAVCVAMDGRSEYMNQKQEATYRKLMNGELPIKTTERQSDFDITKCEDKMHREMQAGRTCPGGLITHEYLIKVRGGMREDVMGNAEIKKLQLKLDTLRAMLASLIALLKLRKV